MAVTEADLAELDTSENMTDGDITADGILDRELRDLEKKGLKTLTRQVREEYEIAYDFIQPKWEEWALRLKLYNNQRRDKKAIGDPLLFTVFQTVFASLYDDDLGVDFRPREQGDEERSENLVALAEYDYDEMQKEKIDYEWDWDATFFGRGLLLFSEFDRKRMVPVPEVVDPMTWLRDPCATSVRGDMKGRGGMAYGGREIRLSRSEMESSKVYFNLGLLKNDNHDSTNSLFDKNRERRAEAQGLEAIWNRVQNVFGANKTYRLLEWYTNYYNPRTKTTKKVLITLANNMTVPVRYQEFEEEYFPILDRVIFPMAHDWDGVSIPDLIEDKQRARAVLSNLALKGVELNLYPALAYDSNKIKNRDSLNTEFNKYIGVDGSPAGAIAPLQRDAAVKAEVQYIMELLDTAAQRATATPEIQQGVQSNEPRTLGELNLVASKVDTRYSLAAKIWGWSEEDFWRQWYHLYKENFNEDIDEKVVRITGALGYEWRPLTRDNFIMNTDPDTKIESKVISDAKKYNEANAFRSWLVMAQGQPGVNIRFGLKRMGKLLGLRADIISQILPETIDELLAKEENDRLEKGETVLASVTDDHAVHIEIHNSLPDSPTKFAHIQAHKKAMVVLRDNPSIVPGAGAGAPQGQLQGQGNDAAAAANALLGAAAGNSGARRGPGTAAALQVAPTQ
jgi:hypothetical protein